MSTFMTRWHGLALGGALLAASASAATEVAPDALVRNTAEEVLAIVRQDQAIQSGDKNKVIQLVEVKVLPHFDFSRMTRLAAGKNWRAATPEQQQRLTLAFRELLVRTYTAAFTSYKNQTVEFKPFNMEPAATDVTVRTAIVQPGGPPPIPVDYSMYKTGGSWKVYDVTIEGVSLVTTYRGTFNDEIRRAGIDGLINSLEQKNRTLSQQDAAGARQ
ncbi:MAG: MlaC/ttg2D family ABC transporter substrate-binding protein [Pseudomonadota bacterium]